MATRYLELTILHTGDTDYTYNALDGFINSEYRFGVLKDNVITAEVQSQTVFDVEPVNLYKDVYTCFSIGSALFPDWLIVDSLTRENGQYIELLQGNPGREYTLISRAFLRETTIRALENTGETRECTIILKLGYYNHGYEFPLPESDWVNDDTLDELCIHIIQLSADKTGQTRRPLYKIINDDAIIETCSPPINTQDVTYTIDVVSNSAVYSANKFIPCYHNTFKNEYGNLLLEEDTTITVLDDWVTYEILDYKDTYGNYIEGFPWIKLLKFNFALNNTDVRRSTVITISHENRTYPRLTYTITINLLSKLDDGGDITAVPYLKYSTKDTFLPYTASSYSANFSYLNILGILSIDSDLSWVTIDSFEYADGEGIVHYSWENNPVNLEREAILTISGKGHANLDISTSLKLTLAALDGYNGDPYEGESQTVKVSVIDDNTGETCDPTSLLFKDNNSNIYKTLESKDGTLFLGNFYNTSLSNSIKDLIGPQSIIEDSQTLVLANRSSSWYEYSPDMTLSSLLKKVFKFGENYSLGLVFVSKTGVKSSVFHIGTFSPEHDPELIIPNNPDDSKFLISKPIAKVVLNEDLVALLLALDIIGVIPVYAVRNNHRVIALGFLNTTVSSNKRESEEGLTSQYDWYLRIGFNASILSETRKGEVHSLNSQEPVHPDYIASDVEFQCEGNDIMWTSNSNIVTFNSPELEANDDLSNTEVENCALIPKYWSFNLYYINDLNLKVEGSYRFSVLTPSNIKGIHDRRVTSTPSWYGFLNTARKEEDSSEFIISTLNVERYAHFYVYPWQRDIIGGEGPNSRINLKKYLSYIYINKPDFAEENMDFGDINLDKVCVYRDNFPSLVKHNNRLYQGNVEYIISPVGGYKAYTKEYKLFGNINWPPLSIDHYLINYPIAHRDEGYAGYGKVSYDETNALSNEAGLILSPINMRYRVSPHLVLFLRGSEALNPVESGIFCAELQKNNYVFDDNPFTLKTLLWIKCGKLVPLHSAETEIQFVEGDYFYGRFDSLRTYPFSEVEVNSVTDIVSGMLCSRVNLDARYDRNRGIETAIVTPENFNLFNPVYNQLNNFFNYVYQDLSDELVNRTFSNSIQWSMNKTFGNEIDDWCNILDTSLLDLDGNKGKLTAIKRLNNNIIAFQNSGIALILYNESALMATTEGVPIELANSGKVSGKRYIYDGIGCQNMLAITSTPSGLYFVDYINRTFYKLQGDLTLLDICTSAGMKSWGLSNIDSDWKCWYDIYSLEVVFNSSKDSILYSDISNRFLCFSSYEGIDYILPLNGRTYMFKQTRTPRRTYQTLWKKNAIDAPIFFSIPKKILLEITANAEYTLDKTFTNIEYRADGFNGLTYNASASFDTIRVYNEYQDTFTVPLTNTRNTPSNLKKKFRMWHIDIPRSRQLYSVSISDIRDYVNGTVNSSLKPSIENALLDPSMIKPIGSPLILNKYNKDRIRNPWCNIVLTSDMKDMTKFIVHDLLVLYIV